MKEYRIKRENLLKERRKEKHDFKKYFVEKGVELNVDLKPDEKLDIIYLDFETTGLSSRNDEILQTAIIDGNGRVGTMSRKSTN